MDDAGTLNHTKWQCKYHVAFIAKCNRKLSETGNRHHQVGHPGKIE